MPDIQTADAQERRQILQEYKHIAVVGISADPYRASHSVSAYMQRVGYDLVMVNPVYAGQKILGKHVYPSLTEAKAAGEKIEIVDVFRRAESIPPIADEAIAVGAKVLWLQLGIRNNAAIQKAQQAGLQVVQDSCVKVEHAMLL